MLFDKRPCPYSYCTLAIVAIFFIYNLSLIDRTPLDTFHRLQAAISSSISKVTSLTTTTHPSYLDFPAPSPSRNPSDVSDVFAEYRNQDMCHLSSLDLHIPFEPLCPDIPSVLRAMSWGGRPGFDAPYIPYACDMRFYSSAEMCEILGRFSGLVLAGDSIVRHVTNAFWIMMRGDMGYGAIRGWDILHKVNRTVDKVEDCACRAQFADSNCNTIGFHQSDWKLKAAGDEALRHVCGAEFPLKLTYQPMLDWPLDPVNLKRMMALLPEERPEKPVAMVFGHALWNNVDLNKTELWLDDVLENIENRTYALEVPKLFLSTNAGGMGKPNKWLQTQSVNKMASFELGVQPLAESKGMDFLGTYNMSVQAGSIDGTHAVLEVNLLKAMMVFNWLDKLDLSKWEGSNDKFDPELSP